MGALVILNVVVVEFIPVPLLPSTALSSGRVSPRCSRASRTEAEEAGSSLSIGALVECLNCLFIMLCSKRHSSALILSAAAASSASSSSSHALVSAAFSLPTMLTVLHLYFLRPPRWRSSPSRSDGFDVAIAGRGIARMNLVSWKATMISAMTG